MISLYGSRRDLRGGCCLRGAGHADSSANATVRRPTEYFNASARLESPSSLAFLRIAAYNSTLEPATYAPHIP